MMTSARTAVLAIGLVLVPCAPVRAQSLGTPVLIVGPTALDPAAPGAWTVQLSWAPVANAQSVLVQFSLDPTFTTGVASWESTRGSVTGRGLLIGSTYYFRAFGVIRTPSFVQGPYSSVVSAQYVAPTAPTAPTAAPPVGVSSTTDMKLTLGAVTSNSISVSWNQYYTAQTYIVDVSLNGANAGGTLTKGTSWTATNLTPGTTYNLKVTPADQVAGINGPWSNVVTATTLAVVPTPTPSVPTGWAATSYQAWDIAVGANGAVWFTKPDRSIWRVTNGVPAQMPGGATRIAVDPAGLAWVVNDGNQIYQWTGSTWILQPGLATDIGIGANGKVWILGMDNVPAVWNGSTWTPLSGGGQRLTVDKNGWPWVTNHGNQIWRYTGTTWQLLAGAASDLSAGPDGTVYVLGLSGATGGSQIYRWDGGTSWIIEDGVYGGAVAAGAGTHAWVARTSDSGLPVIAR